MMQILSTQETSTITLATSEEEIITFNTNHLREQKAIDSNNNEINKNKSNDDNNNNISSSSNTRTISIQDNQKLLVEQHHSVLPNNNNKNNNSISSNITIQQYFISGYHYVKDVIYTNRWALWGTAGSWFILDIVFYANGLFSGQVSSSMGFGHTPKSEAVASLILQVYRMMMMI